MVVTLMVSPVNPTQASLRNSTDLQSCLIRVHSFLISPYSLCHLVKLKCKSISYMLMTSILRVITSHYSIHQPSYNRSVMMYMFLFAVIIYSNNKGDYSVTNNTSSNPPFWGTLIRTQFDV